MDKEEQKRIHKKISLFTLLALVIVIVVMIGGTFMGWLSIIAFRVIACLYLAGYWAATDILEPKLTKLLEGVTEDQKKAYQKYAAMDLAGYIGILVFIVSAGAGGASSIGMIGLVVYAYTLSAKKKYQMQFKHPEKIQKKQAPVQKKEMSIREKAALVKPVPEDEERDAAAEERTEESVKSVESEAAEKADQAETSEENDSHSAEE